MNYPISGSLPSERLSAPPVLMLDVDATGIAITRVAEEFTVLVVTTDEGELAKVGEISYQGYFFSSIKGTFPYRFFLGENGID